MKKLLTYVSFLLLAVSCNTNKSVVAKKPEVSAIKIEKIQLKSDASENSEWNVAKENNTDEKPVVLKRTMRRPAVI